MDYPTWRRLSANLRIYVVQCYMVRKLGPWLPMPFTDCRNDRAMIRWICGVKPTDDPSMDDLNAKLGICDLAILVRERRLRWFGHVMRSNGEINRVRSRPVPGRKGPGRPKKTWDECVKQDLKVCGLSEAGTQDRVSWRSSVKNSRQEPTPPNRSAPEHGFASVTARSGDAHPLL